MKVVWKYVLGHRSEEGQVISMPFRAHILDVQMQRHEPVMWALVNPELRMVERRFVLIWTGEERSDLHDGYIYVGTFQDGPSVYHLFEKLDDDRPF